MLSSNHLKMMQTVTVLKSIHFKTVLCMIFILWEQVTSPICQLKKVSWKYLVFIKWKLRKHFFDYKQTLLCRIFGLILWWWDKKYGLRFFSLLPMKNAADVLHQQQHSIELASAISKIRLHFPMHRVSNRIMLMQCPHSGQIWIHRVSD